MKIQKVFVVGSGTMGNGIAQVCAQSGIDVTLCDLSQDVLENAVKTINWSVGKLAGKGLIGMPRPVLNRRLINYPGVEKTGFPGGKLNTKPRVKVLS